MTLTKNQASNVATSNNSDNKESEAEFNRKKQWNSILQMTFPEVRKLVYKNDAIIRIYKKYFTKVQEVVKSSLPEEERRNLITVQDQELKNMLLTDQLSSKKTVQFANQVNEMADEKNKSEEDTDKEEESEEESEEDPVKITHVEEIVKLIKQEYLGVKIMDQQIGILHYADDILLLSDEVSKRQRVIRICEEFGKQNEIKFNPEKTQLVTFGNKKWRTKKVKFYMNEKEIE
ncbi:unnamed protein product [Brachionus calyciflorus]|uniref:Reverse transcriptase domain-containing protein n=1 Tax=Brachionus calyciflorus TaxID=104777 RepID=A0A814GZ87_9BILA|nr:unnamed protein product [Brachionus calyciflorus]